ncbi:hypothetical protein N7532_001095 [Penicillium argentinense]|uniref:DUF7703 domain-containing protein n=1 Tax=Penicillium argentinense TaxID=1131581 RepID=A0A9W9G1V5_9EURO|nr:uncharacterized protein N7532_001095 [Penicillium argentinense]KAJ5110560.1 hypothetical protein N7532_001095 [Penicillium argentinense]
MDTRMPTLPPEMGEFVLKNIATVEVVAMFAIGTYSALEVGIACLDLFKRYRGLYFFSMQVASWGILLHSIPAQVRFVTNGAEIPLSIPYIIGWYCMVSGQPVVLYSRLHLVVADMGCLRWLLWMIIINAVVMHIPMTVLFYFVTLGSDQFVLSAAIYDRIQVVVFAAQDLIICAIYIREALRALGPVLEIRGREGRKVIIHLIAINLVVMIMNILLIVTEFKAHFIQISFKTVVYSVKLKLEFTVLNKLRTLVSTNNPYIFHANGHGNRNNNTATTDTIDPSRRSSDLNIYEIYALVNARHRESSDTESQRSVPHINIFNGSLENGVSVENAERIIQERGVVGMENTLDFRNTLRETTSRENMHLPSPSPTADCFLGDSLSSDNCYAGTGPHIGSTETRSTFERQLLESHR